MTASTQRESGQPAANHLWIALARAYRSMSQLVEQSVAKSGLGLTDFMLLEALLHKGPLTITEVQASILLATGSMTAAVDRVEARGLIVRKAIKEDRRARRLELTPAGRKLIESAYRDHSSELEGWLSVLTSTEQAGTFKALRKLGQHAARWPSSTHPAKPSFQPESQPSPTVKRLARPRPETSKESS